MEPTNLMSIHQQRFLSQNHLSFSCANFFVIVVSYSETRLQAKILAKYKPTINATLLIPELKQIEQTTAKAIEYFKSTRHIVFYYEDLITNRAVRLA